MLHFAFSFHALRWVAFATGEVLILQGSRGNGKSGFIILLWLLDFAFFFQQPKRKGGKLM